MFWRAIVFFYCSIAIFLHGFNVIPYPELAGDAEFKTIEWIPETVNQFCLLLLLRPWRPFKIAPETSAESCYPLRILYQFTFCNWHIDPFKQILCFYLLTQNLPTSGPWTGMFTLLLPSALRGIYCTCIRHPQVLLWTQDTIFSNLLASLPS